MSNQHLEVLRDNFYDNAEREYTITVFDSDGTELGYKHGTDYEELCEGSLPEFSGQVMYELTAEVNGEEVPAKRTSFTEAGCLEKFNQIEDATDEFTEELFEDSISVDYDSAVKERML